MWCKNREEVAAESRAYLMAGEVARALGIGLTTVYNLAKSGDIPSIRVGFSWRFPKAALCERYPGIFDGEGKAA